MVVLKKLGAKFWLFAAIFLLFIFVGILIFPLAKRISASIQGAM